jgi:hypothetical protein
MLLLLLLLLLLLPHLACHTLQVLEAALQQGLLWKHDSDWAFYSKPLQSQHPARPASI